MRWREVLRRMFGCWRICRASKRSISSRRRLLQPFQVPLTPTEYRSPESLPRVDVSLALLHAEGVRVQVQVLAAAINRFNIEIYLGNWATY